MRTAPVLIPLLLASGVSGCDDTEPGPSVTITLMTDTAPPLVVVRDGLDGPWQPATMKTPTRFEAVVHGPYTISVVCEDATSGQITLWQEARTPDDERETNLRCDFRAQPRHPVTGNMVQPGRVQLGGAIDTSITASWTFDLDVGSGTYDLMARTDDRIVLRRAISVTGPLAVTPAIDVLQEGTALAPVAFTATNAAPGESLVASVHLDQPFPAAPFGVYRGPIEAARVVPDSALSATDKQSVSIQAMSGPQLRALRRPFRIGGDTAYTLPAPLGGVQWEFADGKVSVSWSSVPEFDLFSVGVRGTSPGAAQFHSLGLSLSPRFVAETGITRATVDTDLPGYKPEWQIDFTREHQRDLFVQRTAGGEIASSTMSETLNAGAAARVHAAPPCLPLADGRLAQP